MKHSIIKSIISVAAVTVFAANAFAAVPGGPKPKCPLGQIAVKENGSWVCKEPSIKAPGKAQMSTTGAKNFKAPGGKPPRAKADLIVEQINLAPGNNKRVAVNIKNIGKMTSKGGKAQVKLPSGKTGSSVMPDIKPGQTRLVYVDFRKPVKGRVTATADHTKQVPESNENNNSKTTSL